LEDDRLLRDDFALRLGSSSSDESLLDFLRSFFRLYSSSSDSSSECWREEDACRRVSDHISEQGRQTHKGFRRAGDIRHKISYFLGDKTEYRGKKSASRVILTSNTLLSGFTRGHGLNTTSVTMMVSRTQQANTTTQHSCLWSVEFLNARGCIGFDDSYDVNRRT